ncbi:hypothetical protein MHYP_G00360680 [Metynnis hypsauchen]
MGNIVCLLSSLLTAKWSALPSTGKRRCGLIPITVRCVQLCCLRSRKAWWMGMTAVMRSSSSTGRPVQKLSYDLRLLHKKYQLPEKEFLQESIGDRARNGYDQWRANQLRIQHIIEHFGKRQPSENKLRRFIGRQEWTSNVPDFDHVLKYWTPPRVHDRVKDNGLIQMVRSQKWKGLQITAIPGKKKGVVTTNEFACGDIVCDYHGTVVSRKEGLTTYNSTGKDTGYMFFYQDKSGTQMCIDAHLE